ncbi:MAG: molybdopterin-guanine dinucleotide biosynthesis protein B, partial [Candidatus Lokiarchaeota archaeon]|nr:molybdopterin-guanine dinucleotide biosynthesis protein B [Candidatus Lokiarchaeota archaeon]
MKQQNIIEFKGFSNSGKTASIEAVLKFLKENNRNCAAIKSIHIEDFSIDKPGKNTWVMSKTGADPVIAVSKNET